jgi:hypothetical protein
MWFIVLFILVTAISLTFSHFSFKNMTADEAWQEYQRKQREKGRR